MNYYELLGIPETATEEEIKKAYKIQMKKWHPDINKDEKAVSMSIKINLCLYSLRCWFQNKEGSGKFP